MSETWHVYALRMAPAKRPACSPDPENHLYAVQIQYPKLVSDPKLKIKPPTVVDLREASAQPRQGSILFRCVPRLG